MRSVKVDLGAKSYEVLVGQGIISSVPEVLEDLGLRAGAIIADEQVAAHWLPKLGLDAPALTVAAGESSKSLDQAEGLLERMAEAGLIRDSAVITLGGGMVGDLGGFVASVFMRGVPVIGVPTTLLAQLDSSIGGKTAVNLLRGKNLVGTFHQPRAVICDVECLQTLDERHYRQGFAEAIKYGVVFDESVHSVLADEASALGRKDPAILEDLVARCAGIKAEVVSADERELSGERMLLNFGHTYGHALEAAGEGKLLHGEAVSLGMVFAAELSSEIGELPREDVDAIRDLISRYGLPTSHDHDFHATKRYLLADKKRGDDLRWVILERLRQPKIVSWISEEHLRAAAERLCE